MTANMSRLVEYRHRLAWLATLLPITARVLRSIRWGLWSIVATPATSLIATALFAIFVVGGVLVWLPLSATWGIAVSVLSAWPGGASGVLLAGALAAGWVIARWRFTQRFGNKSPERLAGALAAVAVAVSAGLKVADLGPLLTLAVLMICGAAVALELLALRWFPMFGLINRVAVFCRELPPHWTDVAARSDRIQSIDVSVERAVVQGGADRPILEHPAIGALWRCRFDLAGFAVEMPIARPEGRTFAALQQILEEVAAQLFIVGDWRDSITVLGVESNNASVGILRVEFKPLDFGPFERWLGTAATSTEVELPDRAVVVDIETGEIQEVA